MRRKRTRSYTDIYHIIIRSVNQQIIFEDDKDYRKFLETLLDCKKIFTFDLYAYCLMNNHVHLLMKCEYKTMSSLFQLHGNKFVTWYNTRYNRIGPLYQGRFKSIPVEDMHYFFSVLLYIHKNPVNAGACKHPNEFPWSSFHAYFGKKDDLVNTKLAEKLCGSEYALQNLLENESDLGNSLEEPEKPKRSKTMTDEDALVLFKDLTGCRSSSDIQHMSREERNDIIHLLSEHHVTQAQIARICGLAKSTVSRILKL